MKKRGVVLVLVLLLLASLVLAQVPPPPPAPTSPGIVTTPAPNTSDGGAFTPTPDTGNDTIISQPPAPTPTPAPITTPGPQESQDTSPDLEPIYNRLRELESSTENFGFYFVLLIIFNIFILIVLVYFLIKSRKKEEEVPAVMKHFIKANLKKGHRAETIKRHLMNEGWSEKTIEKAFEEFQYGT